MCVEMTSFSLDLYCFIYTILSKSSQVPVTSSVGVQMCVPRRRSDPVLVLFSLTDILFLGTMSLFGWYLYKYREVFGVGVWEQKEM